MPGIVDRAGHSDRLITGGADREKFLEFPHLLARHEPVELVVGHQALNDRFDVEIRNPRIGLGSPPGDFGGD